jgi:hypothetical protein
MRVLLCIGALGLVLVASGCKRKPPLPERMGGSWKASMEYGGRVSKDPIVRGWSKFWGNGKLDIFLEVGPDSIEVRRPTGEAKGIVVQRASYAVVGDDRIELTTNAGNVPASVTLECNKEACLVVSFSPDPSSPPAALDAMGFLFGCDDVEGKVSCVGLSTPRSFFRYPKNLESPAPSTEN